MLTIRFSRKGKKKRPFYRVIISEKTKDTQARYLELLGTYDPHSKEANLKKDRIAHWIERGAQTSASVFNLFVREGILKGDKQRSISISKKRQARLDEKNKKDEPAPEAPAAEEKPAEPTEAPKEEVPVEEKKEEKATEEAKPKEKKEEVKEETKEEAPKEEEKKEEPEEKKE